MPKWRPGQSGNPKGRKKGEQTIADAMRKLLESVPEGQKLTYKEAFVRAVYKMALEQGNARAAQLIWNHIDGAPVQKIKHTGDLEDDPIAITQVFVPKKKKEGAE